MPRLPVNRFGRSGLPVDDTLFAVTGDVKNAVRLVSLNAAACAQGLVPGMTLADARAAAPDLVTVSEEPMRDALFLKALQRWCEKFTPWSAYEGKDMLVLNITGCAHLFGGEEAFAQTILTDLADRQVEARIGIADTRGAAKAAVHFGNRNVTIIPAGGTKEALGSYPIDALFTEEKTAFELKRLGLKRIGDLYPLKSADLARRFGFGLLRLYEKLIGGAADPVTPAKAHPNFAARISFPDPIGRTDDVSEALSRLSAQVCRRLTEHGFGLRSVRLSLFRADKEQIHIDIGLARPTQTPAPILRQFALQLDSIDAGCGIDMMRLAALKAEPFKPFQQRFADAEKRSDLDELIATLGNRLGFDRVLRWRPVSSHLPHRAFQLVQAVSAPSPEDWQVNLRRPLMIYDGEPAAIITPGRPPKVFQWRRQIYTALEIAGPERIGPEWWRCAAGDALRDYWRVDCAEGARLWLSTKPQQKPHEWQVAGVFP